MPTIRKILPGLMLFALFMLGGCGSGHNCYGLTADDAAVVLDGKGTCMEIIWIDGEKFLPLQDLMDHLGRRDDDIAEMSEAGRMEDGRIIVPLCFVADVLGVGAGFANDTVILSTRPARRIPILVYHHILPDEKNRVQQTNAAVISTENFARQMRYLYDNNFYTITLDELEAFLYRSRPLPENSVMIHFDDGYYSNFVYAYPILQQYGLRAVVFFITHLIEDLGDDQPPMDHDCITWTAAHTISGTEDIFETASHSHNMHRLVHGTDSTILARETRENILHDTRRSFEFVGNHVAYAYPRGQYNDTVIGALEEAGITMAFTVRNGYVTENSDPMRLNRFVIFRETAFWRFRVIVNGRA